MKASFLLSAALLLPLALSACGESKTDRGLSGAAIGAGVGAAAGAVGRSWAVPRARLPVSSPTSTT